MPEYRIRLPGPTAVPERIRAATAAPIQAHRGAEFKAILAEAQAGLRAVYGTAQDVFLFAGSGTAMMEASLANVGEPRRVLLHLPLTLAKFENASVVRVLLGVLSSDHHSGFIR